MSAKTNAVRLLESKQIPFDIQHYEVDETDLSAEHVAESMGIEPERIFKTLVLVNSEKQYLVAIIPGNAHLDLKKLASISRSKKCEMIPMKDIFNVTGYIRGGCSPIGMKKLFPTYIEETAELFDTIVVSAGKRGLQIVIDPKDLAEMVDANFADLILV